MKKRTRILALAGAVLLIALYLATLVFALIGTSWAFAMFKMCVGFTIIIPVLLYVYQMIYRVLDGRKEDSFATRSQNKPNPGNQTGLDSESRNTLKARPSQKNNHKKGGRL